MVLVGNVNRPFWSGAAGNAVIIEADAFKETDVIYRALSSRGHHDMLQTAELVRYCFHYRVLKVLYRLTLQVWCSNVI